MDSWKNCSTWIVQSRERFSISKRVKSLEAMTTEKRLFHSIPSSAKSFSIIELRIAGELKNLIRFQILIILLAFVHPLVLRRSKTKFSFSILWFLWNLTWTIFNSENVNDGNRKYLIKEGKISFGLKINKIEKCTFPRFSVLPSSHVLGRPLWVSDRKSIRRSLSAGRSGAFLKIFQF